MQTKQTDCTPIPRTYQKRVASTHFRWLLLPVLLLLAAWQPSAQAASVWTDQLDYPPFTDVHMSGTGFVPGETVTMTLQILNPDGSWSLAPSDPEFPNPWEVQADVNGNISDTWYVWTDDFLGVTFRLTAAGSQDTATTTFTDAIKTFLEFWFNLTEQWGGTVQGVNSAYLEGQSIPSRFRAEGLTPGNLYTIILKYDFIDPPVGPVHCFNALESFDRSLTPSIPPAAGATTDTEAFPTDGTLPAGAQAAGILSGWGVTNITFTTGYSLVTGVKQITVQFRAAVSDVTLAFGSRLARENDWGVGNGADSWPGGSGKIYSNFNAASSDDNASFNPNGIFREVGVSITKEASADIVCVGDTLTYTLTVTNVGPFAVDSMTVEDVLPTGVTFDSFVAGYPGTATHNSGTITWEPGAIAINDDAVLQIVVDVTAGAGSSITNTAEITETDPTDVLEVDNTSTVITAVDVNDPVVETEEGSLDVTLECDDEDGLEAALDLEPEFSDDGTATEDLDITVDEDTTQDPNCPNGYVLVRTWTATDDCGNSAQFVQTITVEDTTNPDLTCPDNLILECNTTADYVALIEAWIDEASATDNCDTDVAITTDWDGESVPALSCDRTSGLTVTFTATDNCGNTDVCTATVYLDDSINPEIDCPEDLVLECDSEADYADLIQDWIDTATASDSCDTVVAITTDWDGETVPELSCEQTSGLEITFTATDNCGNTAQCTRTVYLDDSTNPEIDECPEDLVLECDTEADYVALIQDWIDAVTASDSCDTDVEVTTDWDGETVPELSCEQTSGLLITFTATDECGNTAQCTATVYLDDSTNPEIDECPEDLVLECDTEADYVALIQDWIDAVTASDSCDTDVEVTTDWDGETVPELSCEQTSGLLITFTATDECGNTAQCTATVYLDDSINPEIVCPEDLVLECDSEADYADLIQDWIDTATASDSCDTDVEITNDWDGETVPELSCDQTSGLEITFTATDECGNSAQCTRTVYLDDTTGPEITLPSEDLELECFDADAVDDWIETASALDGCDGEVTVTGNYTEPTDFCDETVTVTFTAEDSCGNTAVRTKSFTVSDTTAPEFDEIDNVQNTCGECTIDPEETGEATATDNCIELVFGGNKLPTAGEITYQDTFPDGSEVTDEFDPSNCPWTIIRTWSATDDCGNTATAEQIISCLPEVQIQVTDSSLCTYDLDPSTDCKDFRLLFTQDPQNFPCYKLTASNPGQTYLNVNLTRDPLDEITVTLTIPYPYVTQGAKPLHVYDNAFVTPSDTGGCWDPGNAIPYEIIGGTLPITLASYGPNPTLASTVDITVKVPAGTEHVYINLHLDFGLKKTAGYAKDTADGDALLCNTTTVKIPNHHEWGFSVSQLGIGDLGSDSICNINEFKKLPGVGGLAGLSYKTTDGVTGTFFVPGAKAVLSTGLPATTKNTLTTGYTDADGWYFCNYKWTGKRVTIYITLTPPGGKPLTKSAELKSNGYVQIDFNW